MKRKWWKFLLPIPFIFFYCYCISSPDQKGKGAGDDFLAGQQVSQAIQESPKEKITEPPPVPPAQRDIQSPPQLSANPVPPVPQAHADEAQDVTPVENERPQTTSSDVVPQQNTAKSSAPPPLSPAAPRMTATTPAPAEPDPFPASESKAQDEEVIIALVTLSALENETAQENLYEPPASEQAQELPVPSPDESEKKQKASEYARSTAKVSVSQETFEADKRRIMSMISDLDVYMETGDYKGWSNCLSDESRNYWSKPQNLRKAAAKLPITGIKLNNMEDYFNYVFIPARKGRKVEEIRYVTETQVKAVQVEDDVDLVFYHFKKVDGKWKLFLPKIKD